MGYNEEQNGVVPRTVADIVTRARKNGVEYAPTAGVFRHWMLRNWNLGRPLVLETAVSKTGVKSKFAALQMRSRTDASEVYGAYPFRVTEQEGMLAIDISEDLMGAGIVQPWDLVGAMLLRGGLGWVNFMLLDSPDAEEAELAVHSAVWVSRDGTKTSPCNGTYQPTGIACLRLLLQKSPSQAFLTRILENPHPAVPPEGRWDDTVWAEGHVFARVFVPDLSCMVDRTTVDSQTVKPPDAQGPWWSEVAHNPIWQQRIYKALLSFPRTEIVRVPVQSGPTTTLTVHDSRQIGASPLNGAVHWVNNGDHYIDVSITTAGSTSVSISPPLTQPQLESLREALASETPPHLLLTTGSDASGDFIWSQISGGAAPYRPLSEVVATGTGSPVLYLASFMSGWQGSGGLPREGDDVRIRINGEAQERLDGVVHTVTSTAVTFYAKTLPASLLTQIRAFSLWQKTATQPTDLAPPRSYIEFGPAPYSQSAPKTMFHSWKTDADAKTYMPNLLPLPGEGPDYKQRSVLTYLGEGREQKGADLVSLFFEGDAQPNTTRLHFDVDGVRHVCLVKNWEREWLTASSENPYREARAYKAYFTTKRRLSGSWPPLSSNPYGSQSLFPGFDVSSSAWASKFGKGTPADVIMATESYSAVRTLPRLRRLSTDGVSAGLLQDSTTNVITRLSQPLTPCVHMQDPPNPCLLCANPPGNLESQKMYVDSTKGFPNCPSVVKVDQEEIRYTSTSSDAVGSYLTGLGRTHNGTCNANDPNFPTPQGCSPSQGPCMVHATSATVTLVEQPAKDPTIVWEIIGLAVAGVTSLAGWGVGKWYYRKGHKTFTRDVNKVQMSVDEGLVDFTGSVELQLSQMREALENKAPASQQTAFRAATDDSVQSQDLSVTSDEAGAQEVTTSSTQTDPCELGVETADSPEPEPEVQRIMNPFRESSESPPRFGDPADGCGTTTLLRLSERNPLVTGSCRLDGEEIRNAWEEFRRPPVKGGIAGDLARGGTLAAATESRAAAISGISSKLGIVGLGLLIILDIDYIAENGFNLQSAMYLAEQVDFMIAGTALAEMGASVVGGIAGAAFGAESAVAALAGPVFLCVIAVIAVVLMLFELFGKPKCLDDGDIPLIIYGETPPISNVYSLTYASMSELRKTPWARYFALVYKTEELPTIWFPLRIRDFDVLYAPLLRQAGLNVSPCTPVWNGTYCQLGTGDLYTNMSGVYPPPNKGWDPPGTIWIFKPQPIDRKSGYAHWPVIESNTWIEVTHCGMSGLANNDVKTGSWMYVARGSGIWFYTGNTRAFMDHDDAVSALLNETCNDHECVPFFNRLFTQARVDHNLDSIQFTDHCDQLSQPSCCQGCMAAEIVDTHGNSNFACGNADPTTPAFKNRYKNGLGADGQPALSCLCAQAPSEPRVGCLNCK